MRKLPIYFLIDTKINPHLDPYVVIEESETVTTSEISKNKYILVPDVIIAKIAGANQYRIVNFSRETTRADFVNTATSSRITVIQASDLKKHLQLYESKGLFSVRNDFTSVKARLEVEGIIRVI